MTAGWCEAVVRRVVLERGAWPPLGLQTGSWSRTRILSR